MKKAKQLFCILTALFLLISSAPAVHAATQENEDEDKILAPYFVVQGSSSCIERFPLRATSVNAAINGMIAEIFVTQTYTNEGEEPISARYVFPASSGVSPPASRRPLSSSGIWGAPSSVPSSGV